MSKTHPLRDHGFGDSPDPIGAPRATPMSDLDGAMRTNTVSQLMPKKPQIKECPNCSCKEIMRIEVDVRNRRLRGGTGLGYYIGCPACPWASPMMSVSHLAAAGPDGGEDC